MESIKFCQLFIFLIIFSTVLSLPIGVGENNRLLRLWQPIYDREIEFPVEEGRMKRNLADDLTEPYNKRTNLKRLVLLSARGFGKR